MQNRRNLKNGNCSNRTVDTLEKLHEIRYRLGNEFCSTSEMDIYLLAVEIVDKEISLVISELKKLVNKDEGEENNESN